MPLVEELLTEEALLGTGAAVFGLPLLRRVLRPAAKIVIRSGLILYRGAAEIISSAREETTAAARPVPTVARRTRRPREKATTGPAASARARRGRSAKRRSG